MLQTPAQQQTRLQAPPGNSSNRRQGDCRWKHVMLVALLLFAAAVGNASANDDGSGDPVYNGVSNSADPRTTNTQPMPAAAVETPGPTDTTPGSAAAPPAISVAAGTVAQVAATGVPDRCIIAGSALFSSCAREIAAAQNRFNLTVDVVAPQNYTQLLAERGVTREQAIEALREILAEPSESCCNASCTFNQLLLCDCEPAVLEVAIRFAGADAAFYAMLAEQLAYGCHQRIYFGDSCPADRGAVLAANGFGDSGNSAGPLQAVCEHISDSGDGALPRAVAAVPPGSYSDGYAAGYAAGLQDCGMYGSSSSTVGAYGSDSSSSSSSQGQKTSGGSMHTDKSSVGDGSSGQQHEMASSSTRSTQVGN